MADASVGSSLITMYGKCGSFSDAHLAFEEIKNKNVVCWTAIIAASQQHGYGHQVIELLGKMLSEGNQPDYMTFVSVFAASSHAGKLDERFRYFDSISSCMYEMKPALEHYACMVDMLGQAGVLDEAKKFIESMTVDPDPSILGVLLGAFRNYGNLEMAKGVAERLFEIEPANAGNYVLSNLYTRYGKSEEANEIRRIMAMNAVKKEPGCSWIDIKNKTCVHSA